MIDKKFCLFVQVFLVQAEPDRQCVFVDRYELSLLWFDLDRLGRLLLYLDRQNFTFVGFVSYD